MKFKNENEKMFWQLIYAAVIINGDHMGAVKIADMAVEALRTRI